MKFSNTSYTGSIGSRWHFREVVNEYIFFFLIWKKKNRKYKEYYKNTYWENIIKNKISQLNKTKVVEEKSFITD